MCAALTMIICHRRIRQLSHASTSNPRRSAFILPRKHGDQSAFNLGSAQEQSHFEWQFASKTRRDQVSSIPFSALCLMHLMSGAATTATHNSLCHECCDLLPMGSRHRAWMDCRGHRSAVRVLGVLLGDKDRNLPPTVLTDLRSRTLQCVVLVRCPLVLPPTSDVLSRWDSRFLLRPLCRC
jgi:hypothetical protein